MGKFEDMDGKFRGRCWKFSRTLMGIICDINGEIIWHPWGISRTLLGIFLGHYQGNEGTLQWNFKRSLRTMREL